MIVLMPQINRYLQRCKSPNDEGWRETDHLHKKGYFPLQPVKKQEMPSFVGRHMLVVIYLIPLV